MSDTLDAIDAYFIARQASWFHPSLRPEVIRQNVVLHRPDPTARASLYEAVSRQMAFYLDTRPPRALWPPAFLGWAA